MERGLGAALKFRAIRVGRVSREVLMGDKNCGTGTSSGSGKKTSQRQQQAFQKKQAVIVKKASKLFIKKGYAQTSMRDISKATGINLGNLYYYINSKEEILCLAFNTYHAAMNEALEQKGILDIADPVEQLKAVLRQALENTYDFKDDILMMYRETRVVAPQDHEGHPGKGRRGHKPFRGHHHPRQPKRGFPGARSFLRG